jgi:hypothetical protein
MRFEFDSTGSGKQLIQGLLPTEKEEGNGTVPAENRQQNLGAIRVR